MGMDVALMECQWKRRLTPGQCRVGCQFLCRYRKISSIHHSLFADLQAIQVINPGNLTVVKNLTMDQASNPLTSTGSVSGNSTTPRVWNDAIYVEVCSSQKPSPTLCAKKGDVNPFIHYCRI